MERPIHRTSRLVEIHCDKVVRDSNKRKIHSEGWARISGRVAIPGCPNACGENNSSCSPLTYSQPKFIEVGVIIHPPHRLPALSAQRSGASGSLLSAIRRRHNFERQKRDRANIALSYNVVAIYASRVMPPQGARLQYLGWIGDAGSAGPSRSASGVDECKYFVTASDAQPFHRSSLATSLLSSIEIYLPISCITQRYIVYYDSVSSSSCLSSIILSLTLWFLPLGGSRRWKNGVVAAVAIGKWSIRWRRKGNRSRSSVGFMNSS